MISENVAENAFIYEECLNFNLHSFTSIYKQSHINGVIFTITSFQIELKISCCWCAAYHNFGNVWRITALAILHDKYRCMCDVTIYVISQQHGDLWVSRKVHEGELIVLLNSVILFEKLYIGSIRTVWNAVHSFYSIMWVIVIVAHHHVSQNVAMLLKFWSPEKDYVRHVHGLKKKSSVYHTICPAC